MFIILKKIIILREEDKCANQLFDLIRTKAATQEITVIQDIITNYDHIPHLIVNKETLLFTTVNNIFLQNIMIKNNNNIDGYVIGTENALPFDSRTLQTLTQKNLYIMLPCPNNITPKINDLYHYI